MVAGLGRAEPGRAAAPHFNAYNAVICESAPCNRQTFRLALQRLALLPLSSRTDPAFVPLQQRDNFQVAAGENRTNESSTRSYLRNLIVLISIVRTCVYAIKFTE